MTKLCGSTLGRTSIIVFVALLFDCGSAYAYNNSGSGDPPKGHQWIIQRAVEYVRTKEDGFARRYPLDSYRPWLNQGARWADHTGLACSWAWVDDVCDSIHHYGWADDITTHLGVTVAHPGHFAAPSYASALYSQAHRFWPGRNEPNLEHLAYLDAGYITVADFFDTDDLGMTYLGGLPFCDLFMAYVWWEEHCSDYVVFGPPPSTCCDTYTSSEMAAQCNVAFLTDARVAGQSLCPKWPFWASLDSDWENHNESVSVAMIYLGWAMHMVADLTVPYHAFNAATFPHDEWESWIDDGILGDVYGVPVPPGGVYAYSLAPAFEDYYEDWNAYDFVIEARDRTLDVAGFLDSTTERHPAIAEPLLDLAIKLSAGLLEKYFRGISLPPDELEDNDEMSQATEIGRGGYSDLTLEDPTDEDWYLIHVDAEFSDLDIYLRYEKQFHDIAISAALYSWELGAPGIPHDTPFGKRLVMTGLPVGDYWLHVYPSRPAPVSYSMNVELTYGSLPPDPYEDNNTPESASGFYSGCDLTGTLNIATPLDEDYYFVEASPGIRTTAELWFDPTQIGGQLHLCLDGQEASDVVLENEQSQKSSISACASDGQSLVRVSGVRGWYSLCVSTDADPDCGGDPPQPEGIGVCFGSDVDLDNVRLVTFRGVGGASDAFIPLDDDGDIGGDVPAGDYGVTLTPIWNNPDQTHYVVIGTTQDETDLVVSASAYDLNGADFDQTFPEFALFGGEAGLLADLADGQMTPDLETLLDDAGAPDGILLTPLGASASFYKFSTGELIGKVGVSAFGDVTLPVPCRLVPGIEVRPTTKRFGTVFVGTSSAPETILITNTGTEVLTVAANLTDTTNFVLDPGGCGTTSPTIGVGASCTMGVSFLPQLGVPLAGWLILNSDDPDAPRVTVSVSGEGRLATPEDDSDGDDLVLVVDNCPGVYNPGQGDVDGDDFGDVCDCAPANADVYPGAPEINDGIDNQCPGDPGHGSVDEVSGQAGMFDFTDDDKYLWRPQSGADRYQVVRCDERDLSGDCALLTTTDTYWSDEAVPDAGGVYYYVVKSLAPHSGSWGRDSTGSERMVSGDVTVNAITFVDTPQDDVAQQVLSEFFSSFVALPTDYMMLRIDTHMYAALCAERADFYKKHYVESSPTTGEWFSGSWAKWYQSGYPSRLWHGPYYDSFPNRYGTACNLEYSWCAEDNFGGLRLGAHPADAVCEAFDDGTFGNCSATASRLMIQVAGTPELACGM